MTVCIEYPKDSMKEPEQPKELINDTGYKRKKKYYEREIL